MPASPTPSPRCPYCNHIVDPRSDVLYQGLGVLSGLSAAYCGWCGAIFSVSQWTTIFGKR